MRRRHVCLPLAALALLGLLPAASAEGSCDGPQNIRATVHDEGILVAWDEWSFARAYDVYRAEAGGGFELVATTGGDNPLDGEIEPHETQYLDEDVVPGTTYRYHVQALAPPPHLSDVCGEVAATAIPVFPSVVAVGAAAVLGVVGYVMTRQG